jgi:hypothetical protein
VRTLEIIVFSASLFAIVTIFFLEWRRQRAPGSIKLSAPMLLALRITLGIIFAILGVIGSLLPVLQGWLFFLLAALVLFPKSRFAVAACDKVQPKMPRLIARLRRWGIGTHDEEPNREGDTIRAG